MEGRYEAAWIRLRGWVTAQQGLTSLLCRRAVAAVLDYVVFSGAVFAIAVLMGDPDDSGSYRLHGLGTLFVLLLWFSMFPVAESLFQKSLGKHLLRLRIQTIDRRPAAFNQYLRRRLLDPIDLVAFEGLVAVLAVSLSERRQRLGDMWAGTQVVVADRARTTKE